jgi:A/G-specific adenine glycosylase
VTNQLFQWYRTHGRPLPWRENPSPYSIFLSEIILQQTRVEQGLPYYYRFLETFPSINDLAIASEEEVLKLWQGLGYYSRARNLHKAAKHLQTFHQGIFPSTYPELLKIPGIGPYTARAIMAFAFSKPEVAADGNIWRVTARFFGLTDLFPTTKTIQLTQEIWKDWVIQNPSDFNNSLMDLGSGICTPKNPKCHECPIQPQCQTYSSKAWNEIPSKAIKTKAKPITLLYFIGHQNGKFLMKKRGENSIWANLYDFPEIILDGHFKDEEMGGMIQQCIHSNPRISKLISIDKQPVHLLSHRKIQPFFCFVEFFPILQLEKEEKWVDNTQIHEIPIPKLIESLIATF